MSINILAMVKPTATDENGTLIELPDVNTQENKYIEIFK